jgi:HEAT repeat protein
MSYGKLLLVFGALTAVLVLNRPEPVRAADEQVTADEATLANHKIKHDGASLLDFFRKRTITEGRRERLEKLVKQLGSKKYRERDNAQKELIAQGAPALPFLRKAANDPDLETSTRAQKCLKAIQTLGTELPAAAARLLVVRKPTGAAGVLLNYAPFADDEGLEEEVLTCLGQLAIHDGKVDPVLTDGLKDKFGAKRAAAGWVLARMADVGQRSKVRALLDDQDKTVRQRVADGLVGKEVFQAAKDSVKVDEDLLKVQKFPVDNAGLLAFFRKRTLSEADQQRLTKLVRQLGDTKYLLREKAEKELTKLGTTALPFLKMAVHDKDWEIRRRATRAVSRIQAGPEMSLPAAAARLLLHRAPEGALEVLLGYVPFTNDEGTEEEILSAMCALSARSVKVSPALLKAVNDRLPARRAAAVYVLGRVGTGADCDRAEKLLEDSNPYVRYRASQGFLAAKDKKAVPVLLDLLVKAPTQSLCLQAEDLLNQVALDKAPTISVGEASPQQRKKAHDAWEGWWKGNRAKVNLAMLNRREGFRGLRVICEFDWNGRWNGGTVWECGRDGKSRWKIDNLLGPMDARVLRNGNVLVAENHGRRVAEYTRKGQKVWEFLLHGNPVNGNPVACQRLPNGNTFIACYYNYMEVTKDKKVVYNVTRVPNSYLFYGHKKKNGNIVLMTSMGTVEEWNATRTKQIRSIQVQTFGNWAAAEGLPNGNYLVALMSKSQVQEVDRKGNVRWKADIVGAHTATRMPNGNTLVACMNNRLVAEFDRSGKKVWSKTTQGRPWRIHWR